MLNLARVVASVATVVAGPLALTGPGGAVILAQAVAVMIFAEWQLLALRRTRRS